MFWYHLLLWKSSCNRWCYSKKNSAGGVVRTGERITVVNLNGYIDDLIRIIKLPDNSGVLIDRVSQTVKLETTK